MATVPKVQVKLKSNPKRIFWKAEPRRKIYILCFLSLAVSVWFIILLRPILNKWDKFWQGGVCSWSHMLYFFWYQKHLMAKLCPSFIHLTTQGGNNSLAMQQFYLFFYFLSLDWNMVIQYTKLPEPCHHRVLCWWQLANYVESTQNAEEQKHRWWVLYNN